MSRDHLADHDDFGGLHRDLAATRQAVEGLTAKRFSRRFMVRALGVAVPAAVTVGCGDNASPTSPTSSTSSTDATLTGLTLSTGSLSPSFSAANSAYTASVANAVTSATVTAMASSSTATIKVNGATVATGVTSSAIALSLGTNTITVAVTAADNATTRTYTIVVTRAETVASSCTGKIPSETGGPYPGDGTNGPNVLIMSGIVRSDITSSFGGMSGTAPGVPMTLIMTLVSATTCQPLAGYAVYAWHCTRDGGYSLYTSGFTSQNYLRGIQEADASGQVTFQSIYPGCYSGRWPHIHFEVFPSIGASSSAANRVATSQIALPLATNNEVYASAGYEASVRNQAQVTLASDNVFSDGYSLELATVSGSVAGGYTAMLTVGI